MFKWVHISDLHFYKSKRDDVKKMKETLPKELLNTKNIDALFITGDFRFAKEYKEQDKEEVISYVKELAKALKISLDQVYCVPGNHDLDRGNVREAVIQSLRTEGKYDAKKGYFEDDVLEELKKGFSFFRSVDEGLHGKSVFFDTDNIHVVKKLEKCNIIMLNTSIAAGNDDDRGYLLLGSKYIQSALEMIDQSKPTLMIGHHGNSFLNREENKYIQNKLKEYNVRVYLCGHEHSLSDETVWDNVRQYTAGCIWNSEKSADTNSGYYVGSIDEDGYLKIEAFHWVHDNSKWWTHPVNCDTVPLLFQSIDKEIKSSEKKDSDTYCEIETILSNVASQYKTSPKKIYDFTLNGHTLLGGLGKDGIKYYWIKNGNRVESMAFNTRTCYPHHDPKQKAEDAEISSYTTSVSYGCILATYNYQCRFCETGSREFKGFLSSDEIALQNIFMALYDADCPSFPEVRNHKREFAFMGQGEPGFHYSAIRRAILLTDIAMETINQKVYRYIISSCGISDFMHLLINDIKSGIYKNRVSLHYSLHLIGDERKIIMPIENQYPYKDFLELCKKYYEASHEKVGIGIMMFKNFIPVLKNAEKSIDPITLNEQKLKKILEELDNKVFKIDLCDFNPAPSVTSQRGEFKNEDARKLLKFSLDKKFEAKTFSSFGSDKNAGCGMLKSVYNDASEDGEKTLEQLKKALDLLHFSIQKLDEQENSKF